MTGVGVVSCLGGTVDSYWSGLLGADSTPAPVADPLANMDNRLLYGIDGFPEPMTPSVAGRPGRTSTFALAAARAAMSDAGFEGAGPIEAGVSVGTGVGDVSLFESVPAGAAVPTGVDAFPFKVSSVLAAELGLTGPVTSVSTACSASGYSVSLAADMIRDGEADVVLTGGADGYTRVGVACFNRMGALDPVRCRPFDASRQGTVFGEGAAILVLESEAHARRRGHTRAYATVEGAGWSCDAHHPTAPDGRAVQIVRAMRDALDEAGIDPDEIGCVIPHGTGTPLNDVVESRALETVLGPARQTVPIYSLKALLGHTGGAAAGFALLTAALIVERGVVPPNIPLDRPDPDCALSLPAGAPLPARVEHALVNAYAFGGNNISVLLGRP
ncbi:beta-ketoacyl-[acyl-carrier-protein] synthase family protein [Solwaraspora sp. WMMD1047]|uniref:beta-ketoacyl-[acyl-carrier-protein] synthase family protein n=1 Tax=Solwaraspora sp. WMMD1047 TaxID=3016102 RepID=UPI002416D773|nr:beta-ketoacyl-[acyl-carrier-protein] synthase family protein [Solwaraspora sp. WMMD1047]MDG4831703.1 beta-ketoacyl-[acyl-carrier-protein] synthase family protein [Solwaraspora sp. WMMD1047]